MPDWFWPVVSPLFLGGFVVYRWVLSRQSRTHLNDQARAHGLEYRGSDKQYARRYNGDPFDGRSWPRAKHVMFGTHRSRPIVVFQYSFRATETDRTGDDVGVTRHYQVTTVGLPRSFPSVSIVPRGLFGRMALGAGLAKSATCDEDFDRTFVSEGRDAESVRMFLSQSVREWLLRDSRAAENPVRVQGNELITWQEGHLDVDDAIGRADYLNDLIGQWPEARTP